MAYQNGGGIPAAAGYPQYSGNLISPIISQTIIERFYCSTVFGEISTTDYIGELAKGGDQITFFKEPEVLIRDHIKDAPIKHDTFESKTITLTIDKAKEFSVKIAHVDEFQMQIWDKMKNSLMESAARNAKHAIDSEILGSIFASASPDNSGVNAGVCSHSVNLGEIGAPIVINPTNVLDFLVALHTVMNEQCLPEEGRYLVIPPQLKSIIMRSPELRCADCSGLGQSSILNGRIPGDIAGFTIYVSNCVSAGVDPMTTQRVYNLAFGLKKATVFASQIENTRIIDNDKDTWDTYYQGLMVYGFDTIYPEALGHAYVTLA